jgi:hypothetical protein
VKGKEEVNEADVRLETKVSSRKEL